MNFPFQAIPATPELATIAANASESDTLGPKNRVLQMLGHTIDSRIVRVLLVNGDSFVGTLTRAGHKHGHGIYRFGGAHWPPRVNDASRDTTSLPNAAAELHNADESTSSNKSPSEPPSIKGSPRPRGLQGVQPPAVHACWLSDEAHGEATLYFGNERGVVVRTVYGRIEHNVWNAAAESQIVVRDGWTYRGEVSIEGAREGRGTTVWPDGMQVHGQWMCDELVSGVGWIRERVPGGWRWYEGAITSGVECVAMPEGVGRWVESVEATRVEYVGEFRGGQWHGAGKWRLYRDRALAIEYDGSFVAGRWAVGTACWIASGVVVSGGVFVDGVGDAARGQKMTVTTPAWTYVGETLGAQPHGSGSWRNTQGTGTPPHGAAPPATPHGTASPATPATHATTSPATTMVTTPLEGTIPMTPGTTSLALSQGLQGTQSLAAGEFVRGELVCGVVVLVSGESYRGSMSRGRPHGYGEWWTSVAGMMEFPTTLAPVGGDVCEGRRDAIMACGWVDGVAEGAGWQWLSPGVLTADGRRCGGLFEGTFVRGKRETGAVTRTVPVHGRWAAAKRELEAEMMRRGGEGWSERIDALLVSWGCDVVAPPAYLFEGSAGRKNLGVAVEGRYTTESVVEVALVSTYFLGSVRMSLLVEYASSEL